MHKPSVTVQPLGVFREVMGHSQVTVEDVMDLKGLLQSLAKKYGERFADLAGDLESGAAFPGLMIIVNGRPLFHSSMESYELHDGDEVAITHVVEGG